MRTIKWKLTPGGKDGQMTREEKLKKGREYVKKYNKEEIIDVKEESEEIIITLKDNA